MQTRSPFFDSAWDNSTSFPHPVTYRSHSPRLTMAPFKERLLQKVKDDVEKKRVQYHKSVKEYTKWALEYIKKEEDHITELFIRGRMTCIRIDIPSSEYARIAKFAKFYGVKISFVAEGFSVEIEPCGRAISVGLIERINYGDDPVIERHILVETDPSTEEPETAQPATEPVVV